MINSDALITCVQGTMPGVMGIIQIMSLYFHSQGAYSPVRKTRYMVEILFSVRHHLVKGCLDRAWRLRGLTVVPGFVEGLLEKETGPGGSSQSFPKENEFENTQMYNCSF